MRNEYDANLALALDNCFTDKPVPLVLPLTAVVRSMRCASRQGFDPYNSFPVQSAKWSRAWNDKARRSR